VKGHAEALRLLEEAEIVCDADCVQREVARMAREITALLAGEFPVILSVMGGAAVFTGQLLRSSRFRWNSGAIEVTRYNNDIQGREITWRLPPRDNVRGRIVLVVDDILDEGITLAAIHQTLLSMGAVKVYSAVFADKGHRAREAGEGGLRGRHGAQPVCFSDLGWMRTGCGATCPPSMH
jgi:hypoxanthine phosphoribosyltransferase